MKAVLSFVVVGVLLAVGNAEYGECTFSDKFCSCKVGSESEGICLDKVPGKAICTARTCVEGWTCSCHGRTHLCEIKKVTGYKNTGAPLLLQDVLKTENPEFENEVRSLKLKPVARNAAAKIERPCTTHQHFVASKVDLKLGNITFHFSEIGMLAGKCNVLAWWLNGKKMGDYRHAGDVNSGNLKEYVTKFSKHSLLEIRPGDLVAFRFRAGTYHCYKHLTSFIINGRRIESTAPGFSTRFARQWTKNWFKKSFTPTLAEEETRQNLQSFVPLRKHMIKETESDAEVEIIPDADMFSTNYATANHQVSNFYYRIQIPEELPPIEA